MSSCCNKLTISFQIYHQYKRGILKDIINNCKRYFNSQPLREQAFICFKSKGCYAVKDISSEKLYESVDTVSQKTVSNCFEPELFI